MNVRNHYRLSNLVGGLEDEFALVLLAQQQALQAGVQFQVFSSPEGLRFAQEKVTRVKDLLYWWQTHSINRGPALLGEVLGESESSVFLEIFRLPFRWVTFPGDEISLVLRQGQRTRSYTIVYDGENATFSKLPHNQLNHSVWSTQSAEPVSVELKLVKASPFRELLEAPLYEKPFLVKFLEKFSLDVNPEDPQRIVPEGGLIGLLALLDVTLQQPQSVRTIINREYVQDLLTNPAQAGARLSYLNLVVRYQQAVEQWVEGRYQDIFNPAS